MTTRVVNLKKEKYDVYIGRAGKGQSGKYGNPFITGKDGNRKEVIAKHRNWVYKQPELIKDIKKELKGKRLGCFCKPKSCHGDVYVEICDGLF